MALTSAAVVSLAKTKLASAGFNVSDPHSKNMVMITALAEALVDVIKSDMQVIDPGGTSSGKWSVE